VIFLTGEKHAGKTGMLLELVQEAQARGLHTAGIASPGLWDAQGHRAGFDLLELDTDHRYPLSRRIHGLWPIPYMFDAESVSRGRKALSVARCKDADLVIVDEVGPLELTGGGWAGSLPALLSLQGPVHVWVVRRSLLQAVQDRFQVRAEAVDIENPRCLVSFASGKSDIFLPQSGQ
jgi:nucleoside-triphosphatase THEP1